MMVVVMSTAAVMIVVMVVMSAAAVMIVVMVIVSTAAVIIIVFGDGLPAVFVEYHTDLIHNQNLLLLEGGFINRLHQHIHHVMDGIDRGQGTCQILHCQLSGLGRQGVEVVSCFCNKRIKEGFLFLCGCGRKLLRDIEMEQFIVQITEEAFADEFLCHENLFGIRGEVGEGACLLQSFIFFLTDGICFINDRLNGCLQLLCEGIQISRFFGQSQLITDEIADTALAMLEIDKMGLDHIDRNILLTMINKFGGGPVGLETLAAAVSEETDTIGDVYEPYLLQLGFINRTPRGRVVTKLGYEHLGLTKTE